MSNQPSRALLIFSFALVYVIWGSTYLAIRIAIETLPPFVMAGTRFFCAGIILYVIAKMQGAPNPEPVHWKSAWQIGALLLLGGNGAVVWAEQWVPTGITALIIATVPLWTVLIQTLWFREKLRKRILIGIVFGFIGLWILVGNKTAAPIYVPGIIALLFAALSWSIGSLYSRHAKLPKSGFLAIAMEMICGSILILIVATLLGEWKLVHFEAISTASLLALGYLITFGALIGFTAYLWLVKVTPPALSSTYAYVNPVVAVFLGWAFANESVDSRIFIGAGMIVLAVVLISSTFRKRTKIATSN
jgi:drug/metabolite transporter (DMT)-like permease